MKLTILWTALPAGFTPDGTLLRLSVLASPRLDPLPEAAQATLDAFPAIRDWASQAIGFSVVFTPGGTQAATRVSGPPDVQKWSAVFPATTPVRPFESGEYSTRRVVSYPVANVAEFLRRQYARAGVLSPSELPPIEALVHGGFTDIRTVDVVGQGSERRPVDRRPDVQGRYLKRFGTARAIPPGPPAPEMDFFQAEYFFRPRSHGPRTQPVSPPDFDFNQGLAALGDHPELLKLFGLIVDVTVPLAGQPASGVVQVLPSKTFASGDVSARTHYALDAGARRFFAVPAADSDLAPGWLQLETDRHDLVQVDTDGGSHKAIEFANHLVLRHEGWRASMESETTAGLPALRSGGVALVRTGRALLQAADFTRLSALNAAVGPGGPGPELFADDVVRGYRVDVEDGGTWRSLCRRRATYRFVRLNNLELPPVVGEGTVTTTMMQHADKTKTDEVLLHEALFHWDGWSLVAPRPGMAIDKPKTLAPGEKPYHEQAKNVSGTPLELEVDATVVDASLPRLRFGRAYRLRARTVDLAGNCEPFDSADASHASPTVVYRRFEPVESPALLVVTNEPLASLPGESAARLVIRSRNADESLDALVSPEISSRALLPPRTSVTMAEQSGVLDTPGGLDASATTWDLLAAKDETVLPDSAPAAPAEVPYLPDPFASGAVFRDLPGSVGIPVTVSFETGPDWIRAKPFTLSIVEGSAAPDWDATARTLTVSLPKAAMARVRVSSLVTPQDVDRMAVWHWIAEEAFDAGELASLQALAVAGGHWMITPFREVTLVHAVQQPLTRPVITALTPIKALGGTFATIQARVAVHAASTGKIDLLGTWTEPTGSGPAATDFRTGGSHAFEVPVHDASASEVAIAAADGKRHEFGDTKYRRVHYTAVGSTRFRDYFPAAEVADPAHVSRESPVAFDADVLNSARPAAPDLLYIIPTFEWQAESDVRGTVSRRRCGLRVYLRPPWFSSGEGELLGVVVWPRPGDGCSGSAESPPPTLEALEQRLRYVTQWGRDPIWLTGSVHDTPGVKCFTRAVTVESNLAIEEDARPMSVAAHEVAFDSERKLFYADLDIDAGPSYFPFVRLALARYQPKSVRTAELSRVVLADFVQFAPDRLCWVAREPDGPRVVHVVVSGTGYQANRSFTCTSAIEARLERFLGPGEGNLGWVPISLDTVTLTNVQALKTLAAWQGTLAQPPAPAGARFRVVVEEWESFVQDVPKPGQLPADAPFGEGRQRRLVYADAVELPPV